LVSEDAPHEYACDSPLVELALDEGERFCSPRNVSGLCLVEGKLTFDKPLEDRKTPVGIFKVQLRWLVDHHDLWLFNLWQVLPLCSYRGRVLVAHEDPVRYRLAT
jgi:hypothetical protein